MKEMHQIVVLNPGSTSTKLAVYEDDKNILNRSVDCDPRELDRCQEIIDQLPYRYNLIQQCLEDSGIDLHKTDAFSAICTGLRPVNAGVYEVNEKMYADGAAGVGSKHPGNLGPLLAHDFARRFGGRAFVVDASAVDQFCLEARLTGMKEVLRISRGHPLNQRAAAKRCAADLGKPYKGVNLVVVHMGGGISVCAHQRGRMIDNVDSTRGEGRMAPTRSGAVPAADVIEMCFSNKYSEKQMLEKVMKVGGWCALLGTSDAREVVRRIEAGDRFAELVLRTTAYQIAKDVGAMAAVLKGQVDAVVLTAGLAYCRPLVDDITNRVAFLAPVMVYPGEFEMKALSTGALKALRGEEAVQTYTGKPVFRGFEEELKG
jgi:butyrate kinase